MSDSVDRVEQQRGQTAKLFNDYLRKGHILVRYALEASPRREQFQIEVIDLENKVLCGDVYAGLVHLVFRGGVLGNNIRTQGCECRVHGPEESRRVTAAELFDIIADRWATFGDPIVVDGKCLWMESEAFVGCVKPRGDMKGLSTVFPSSHSWVFPFMCLFAGQFSSLVHRHGGADNHFKVAVLDGFVDRFHSFFVQQCWHQALGRPAA